MKNGLGNLGTSTLDDPHRIIRNRLKRIQYRPELIDGFLAQAGLTLDAPRSWPINLCSNFTGERRPDSPSPAGGHRSRLRRGDYRARGRASPLIYSLGMAGALLLAFSRDAEDVPCPRC
jgi:hypothetical protein